jgi:hypothetical protein
MPNWPSIKTTYTINGRTIIELREFNPATGPGAGDVITSYLDGTTGLRIDSDDIVPVLNDFFERVESGAIERSQSGNLYDAKTREPLGNITSTGIQNLENVPEDWIRDGKIYRPGHDEPIGSVPKPGTSNPPADKKTPGSTTEKSSTTTTRSQPPPPPANSSDGDIIPISQNGEVIGYQVRHDDNTLSAPFATEAAANQYHSQLHQNNRFDTLASMDDGVAVLGTNGNVRGTVSLGEDGRYYVSRADRPNEINGFNNREDALDFAGAENPGKGGGKGGASRSEGQGERAPISTKQKIMGVVGIAALAYSTNQLLAGKVNAGSISAFALSNWMTISNLPDVMAGWGGIFKAHPNAMTAAIVASMFALIWAIRKAMKKGDVTPPAGGALNPGATAPAGGGLSQPQAVGTPPGAWYSWLEQMGSAVYYILPAAITLTIGIGWMNLAPGTKNFDPDARILVKSTELPAATAEFARITGKTMPSNIVGPTFVKKGEPASGIADLAVFMTAKGDGSGDYYVNKVSLNRAGYLTSQFTPDVSMIPFWLVEPQTGKASPNATAFEAVQASLSIAEAQFGGISPESARNAQDIAAALSHR